MIAKHLARKISRILLALVGALGLSTVAFAQNGLLGLDHPNVRAVAAVQNAETPRLMATAGILGTAIGQEEDGEISFVVFVSTEANNPGQIIRSLPLAIRGVRVSVQLTEPFRALGKPGGGGSVSHKAIQTPPIQLGTSGGWADDLANGYCCGGTLGSLVRIGSDKYIMSNFHVFEADTVLGGNGRVADTGDPVIQPGLIDVSCNKDSARVVARLEQRSALPGANVDVSIAKVEPGMVDTDGKILQIGTISKTIVAASFNQAVKKSGRTSGLTRSKINYLNLNVNVTYENECAGGTAFTKFFSGQIGISNARRFLVGGDSGSLLVEDVTTNPRPIGLLYAGSSTVAIANPIGEVLSFLGGGAEMVGQ